MKLFQRLLEPKAVAYAHCDLPCGVYDPAQARIEAESIKGIDEKYQQNTDPAFRARCLIIKEQRSELERTSQRSFHSSTSRLRVPVDVCGARSAILTLVLA